MLKHDNAKVTQGSGEQGRAGQGRAGQSGAGQGRTQQGICAAQEKTAPEGGADGGCPDQPPSTFILLVGPATSMLSTSAATQHRLQFIHPLAKHLPFKSALVHGRIIPTTLSKALHCSQN